MSDALNMDLTGKTIASQFGIINKLGAGGMGAVYLAEQIDMGRKVVVKVIHPELTAGSPMAVERFKREARAVAALNHPNIVQVYVFGQTETGQLYLAMEFVDGRDLTVDLRRGRMHQTRALRVLDQVSSALIEAHNLGIVHRDLKPDNIMLTDRHGNPDYVKVLDFGIAKMMGDENQANLTQAGAVFGTPRYMAPEQAKGKQVDIRADIYALGIIFYEMLTGAHPFKADSAIDYLVKHTTELIQMPNDRFEGLDIAPRTEAILRRCTEKDPDARYQSAAELQRDIRQTLRDFPDAVREYPTPGMGSNNPLPTIASGAKAAALTPDGDSSSLKWLWIALLVLVIGGGGGTAMYMAMSGDGDGDGKVVSKSSQNKGATNTDDDDPDDPKPDDDKPDPKPDDDKPDPKPDDDKPDPKPDDDKPKVVEVIKKVDTPFVATPTPDAPPAVPELRPGIKVDGFQLPDGLTESVRTAQALVYTTQHSAKDLIAFFKYHIDKDWGGGKLVPNGIQVNSDKSPYVYVTLNRNMGGLMVILSPNVAFEKKETGTDVVDAFGVPIVPGAALMTKTPQTVVYTINKPAKDVFDFYEGLFKGKEGIMLHRMDSNDPPIMSISTQNRETPWQAISCTQNPMGPGIMISVVKR